MLTLHFLLFFSLLSLFLSVSLRFSLSLSSSLCMSAFASLSLTSNLFSFQLFILFIIHYSYFFYLVFIVRMRDISSPIVSNTSLFVLFSAQLKYFILLHISSLFISSFLIVHVSEPYSITLHISVFINHIFNVPFTFPLRSSLQFENASSPFAIPFFNFSVAFDICDLS